MEGGEYIMRIVVLDSSQQLQNTKISMLPYNDQINLSKLKYQKKIACQYNLLGFWTHMLDVKQNQTSLEKLVMHVSQP